jgi:DNA helicase MCM8
MHAHTGQSDRTLAARQRLKQYRASGTPSIGGSGCASGSQNRRSLDERLLDCSGADADPVPPQLLRRFIAYARAHCHPRLSGEAKQVPCLTSLCLPCISPA